MKFENANRKALANAIGEIIAEDVRYAGPPSFAYEVGEVTIERDGNVVGLDLGATIERLAEAGFTPAPGELEAEQNEVELALQETPAEAEQTEGLKEPHEPQEAPAEAESNNEPTAEQEADTEPVAAQEGEQGTLGGLKIHSNLSIEEYARLKAILVNKGFLIKKALGLASLPVEMDEENETVFAWFEDAELTSEEARIYTNFIGRLCKLAICLKRVNSNESTEVPNEKYAFRCFLLRLGYKGEDTKADRKLLMKNFTGSSAFRDGKKPEK